MPKMLSWAVKTHALLFKWQKPFAISSFIPYLMDLQVSLTGLVYYYLNDN